MKHFEDENSINDDYEFNTMSHMKDEDKKEYDDYGSCLFRHWITDLEEYENSNNLNYLKGEEDKEIVK